MDGDLMNSPVFRTTQWNIVLAAGDQSCAASDEALEKLCQAYRYPIYAFARRSGSSHEDAEDLTQSFFAILTGKRDFSGVDRKKGKFRTYLLVRFKNFCANERRFARAEKRGGGQPLVSLNDESAKAVYENCCSNEISADKLFDREWAITLLERVTSRLRDQYKKERKQKFFKACSGFLTSDKPDKTYAALAEKLGVKEGALKMAVVRMKERFEKRLRAEIAMTVASAQDIDDEIRELRAALRP
jgi:RNA polymerase sigma factor (sigma-70 family)